MTNPHLLTRTESSLAVTRRLGAAIDAALRPWVPSDGRLALLDFPDYSNVGDAAIWLGELTYLRRQHGVRPAYVCHLENYDPEALRRSLPAGPIFLSGGGNFGDLWPGFQEFRERVLADFPDRTVVQLPQSIHFQSQRRQERTARAIQAHGDVVLMVRDEASRDLAERHFDCRVELVPDMAFALGPLAWPRKPELPRLGLLRNDRERLHDVAHADATLPRADWVDGDVCGQTVRRRALLRLLPELGLAARDPMARREHLYGHLAAARVARGLHLLTGAETVVSDRLHGHVLCTLLGQRHTLLDNNYGKISRFVETWTRDLEILRVRTPEAELLAIPA